MNELFDIGRPITSDSTFPYIHLAYKYKLDNYRLISSGEIVIKGKNLNIPQFVKSFVVNNNEVLMIANIISGKVVGLTFRTIEGAKDFLTYGNNKGNFYGLGKLDKDFKYGTPIVLVEGLLDCDVVKQFYNNTMAVLTSSLTKNQIAVLTRLTNNVILLFDNDEAGKAGNKKSYYAIKDKCKVTIMDHYPKLKDAGDIVKLDINHDKDFTFISNYYRMNIDSIIGRK
jgi:5S rRNA maturation endonuclease (ribonuclease M5)